MQEKTILKISYLTLIIGLAFLFFYSQSFDFSLSSDPAALKSTEKVLMKGQVKNLKVTDKAVFFELEGEKVITTDVILFPENSIYLQEGDYVEINGQMEEYKGEDELVADKIILK
ncbi:MAG: hypothetical protein AABW53_02515 [Nanoarchaeota archaeon]